MASNDWTTIETFSNRASAELAKGLLDEHGIESEIIADDIGGMAPQLGFKGVKLNVPTQDLEEARDILQIT